MIEENAYLNKYSTLQQGNHKIGFCAAPMLVCILWKLKVIKIKSGHICFLYMRSKMLSLSLDALLMLSERTYTIKNYQIMIARPCNICNEHSTTKHFWLLLLVLSVKISNIFRLI